LKNWIGLVRRYEKQECVSEAQELEELVSLLDDKDDTRV